MKSGHHSAFSNSVRFFGPGSLPRSDTIVSILSVVPDLSISAGHRANRGTINMFRILMCGGFLFVGLMQLMPGRAYALSIKPPFDSLEAVKRDIALCDKLAAHPGNPVNPKGVRGLKRRDFGDAEKAINACNHALVMDRNNLRMMYQLGRALLIGGQYDRAFKLFTRASGAGYAIAQLDLAHMYEEGLGTRRDRLTARNWYQRAAVQNVASAWYHLGVMYERGLGVKTHHKAAASLYFKSLRRKAPGALRKAVWTPDVARALQNLLAEKGFYHGALNGEIDQATRAAMRKLCACTPTRKN